MLIGLVVISATAVLVVGSSALGAVQDQSESEQRVNELQSVSSSINDAIYSESDRSVSELESDYTVSKGATVTIDNGAKMSYNTGRLERDGVVYEGGLVIDGQSVVSAPDFNLQSESTMMRIPQIDHDGASQFNGNINYNGTTKVPIDSSDNVKITIQSEYYEQWYDQLETANANVTKDDASETVQLEYTANGPNGVQSSLRLGMSNSPSIAANDLPVLWADSYNDDEYDENNPEDNAVIATTADKFEFDNKGGGNTILDLRGDFRSSGDINEDLKDENKVDITGSVESNVDLPSQPETSELLLDSSDDWETYDPNSDLTGGLYRYDGDLTIDQDITVTNDSILVVNGDLTVSNDITVEEALDVHVHGSGSGPALTIEGESTSIGAADEHGDDATRTSFFVDGPVVAQANGGNGNNGGGNGNGGNSDSGPEFTGLLHASESELMIDDFTLYGATSVDSISSISSSSNKDNFYIHYDENLEGESPYATEDIGASSLRPISNPFIGQNPPEGDVNWEDESPKSGDQLVDGDATVDSTIINGGLGVSGDGTLDEASVNGNLWISGDADIEGTTLNDDVVVLGSADIENANPISGDLWVEGDLSLGNTIVNDDVYVDGDADIEGGSINGDLWVTGDIDIEDTNQVNGDIIALGDTSINNVDVTNDVRSGGDLDIEDSPTINGEIHVAGSADIEESSAGETLYAEGDVSLDGINGHVNEIFVSGDLDCEGVAVNDIYTENPDTVDGCSGDVTEGNVEPPVIPNMLPPSIGPLVSDGGSDGAHYFDVRISRIEVE